MKKFMFGILAVLLISCTIDDSAKFTGTWKVIRMGNQPIFDKKLIFTIRKEGDKFNMVGGKQSVLMMSFAYDKEKGRLVGKAGKFDMVVLYLKNSDHIAIIPKVLSGLDLSQPLPKGIGAFEYMELEKI
jgi:hypothetical protein